MHRIFYFLMLCSSILLGSCISNNDKCVQELLKDVGVTSLRTNLVKHLVIIPGYGCSRCIDDAKESIFLSSDTIFIVACHSEKEFFLLTNKHLKDYPNIYIDTRSLSTTLKMVDKVPMVYELDNGKFVSCSPYKKEKQFNSERALTELSLSKLEINWGNFNHKTVQKSNVILTNTGKVDLQIDDIILSCDCLKAEYSKHLIPPGDTLQINITFSSDSIGEFLRDINIYGNVPHSPRVIEIKGICF